MTNATRTTATDWESVIDRLVEADEAYYLDDDPLMSDAEYDTLRRSLVGAVADDPSLAVEAAVVLERVAGGHINSTFAPVEHAAPMLSLDNVFSHDDLVAWMSARAAQVPAEELRWDVEGKLDGCSLSVGARGRASDGVVGVGSTSPSPGHGRGSRASAATRGTGLVGESVLANVAHVPTVPLTLTVDVPAYCEIRGEVVMHHDDFEALNERRVKAGRGPYMNPRNTAAGSLRQKDPAKTADRPLTFYAFDVVAWDPGPGGADRPQDGPAFQDWCQANGINVSRYGGYGLSAGDAVAKVREIEQRRIDGTLPFPIDGVVVKVSSQAHRELLGATSRVPSWAIACKTYVEEVRTTIVDIDGNTGRTGKWVPRAQVKPVLIGGTQVTYASLGSAAKVREKDVRIGDAVTLVRRGDVIPHVQTVIVDARDGTQERWTVPDSCNVCHQRLHAPDDVAHAYCRNVECPGRLREQVEYVASRNRGFDLDGVGETLAHAVHDEGRLDRDGVRSWANVFHLDAAEWSKVQVTKPAADADDAPTTRDLGAAVAGKVYAQTRRAVAESDPVVVLSCTFGLVDGGGVGRSQSKVLIAAYGSVNAVREAAKTVGPSAFVDLRLFGAERSQAVVDVLTDPSCDATFEVLVAAGFDLDRTPAGWGDAASQPHVGATFVLTGALTVNGQKASRGAIKDALEALGATVSSSLSGTTAALISDDPSPTTSKGKKATAKNVPIIGQKQLDGLLAGTPLSELLHG